MIKNPYPKIIVDEASGIEVLNEKHQIWEEGYKAGKKLVDKDRACYNCEHFNLCRLRDRAMEFIDYSNKTGNFMGDGFHLALYTLMGSSCYEFKKEVMMK